MPHARRAPAADAPSPVTPAPAGTVVPGPRGAVEHVVPSGNSFGDSGDCWVYLPPGYGEDARHRYPVVCLLHGGSEEVTFFLDLGISG